MVIGYGLKYTQFLPLCYSVVSKFLHIHRNSHPRGPQMGGQHYHNDQESLTMHVRQIKKSGLLKILQVQIYTAL